MVGLYTTPDGRMAALDIERVLAEEDRHLAAAEQRLEDWCGAQLGGRGVRYVTELLREDPATVGDRWVLQGRGAGVDRWLCQPSSMLRPRQHGASLGLLSSGGFCLAQCSSDVRHSSA